MRKVAVKCSVLIQAGGCFFVLVRVLRKVQLKTGGPFRYCFAVFRRNKSGRGGGGGRGMFFFFFCWMGKGVSWWYTIILSFFFFFWRWCRLSAAC